MAEHHPVLNTFAPLRVLRPVDFDVDFLGVRTRRAFAAGMCPPGQAPSGPETVSTVFPPFDDEYFEWLDVLEAIAAAQDTFTMIELGAGYGRWCVRAGAAARRRGGLRFSCIAVEAEPQHFQWMVQHFKDNDIDPHDQELIWAAVNVHGGFVPFRVGTPDAWYGQRVSSPLQLSMPDLDVRRRLRLRSLLGRPPVIRTAGRQIAWVPSVTLAEILSTHDLVDLIDLDIQGLECAVLESAADFLPRVRRVHIGTHSAKVEDDLRVLLTGLGWTNVHDYPSGRTSHTPYGEITFGDGVQSWVNPHAAPRAKVNRKKLAPTALTDRVRVLAARNQRLKAENAELRIRYNKAATSLRDIRSSRLWALMPVLRRIAVWKRFWR